MGRNGKLSSRTVADLSLGKVTMAAEFGGGKPLGIQARSRQWPGQLVAVGWGWWTWSGFDEQME